MNNRDFLECIVEYRLEIIRAEREGRPKPQIPRYAGECIDLICTRMSTRPNFGGYSYRQDMVQEAALNCISAFDNFDPSKSNNPNPFGYFSRIAWRAMLRTIWDERKQTYVKHKNYQRLFVTDEHYEGHDDYVDSHSSGGPTTSDSNGQAISDEIVGKFEESLAKKKRGIKEDPEPEAPAPTMTKSNTIFDYVERDFSERDE